MDEVSGLIRHVAKKLLRRRSGAQSPRRRDWAIGLFTTKSPLSEQYAPVTKVPVIRGSDVSDISSAFVADPFLLPYNDKYHLFFEIFSEITQRGEIACAESDNGLDWAYKGIVLQEPFHLSYPQVIRVGDEIYMVPESGEDLSVRLYRADQFPLGWRHVTTLLSGYWFADPTLFRFDGGWWMFVSTREHNVLNLYYADEITGPWTMHPVSPLIKFDNRNSRPAGRVLACRGSLYRFAQDCHPYYGRGIKVFRITKLNRHEYAEEALGDLPLSDRSGWNERGIHHIEHFQLPDDTWLALIDGFSQFGERETNG